MSLSTLTYYVIAFIALSGLGVVFFNAESILALCFFIFIGLLIMENNPINATLEEQKQGIRSELVSCMIDGQTLLQKTTTNNEPRARFTHNYFYLISLLY